MEPTSSFQSPNSRKNVRIWSNVWKAVSVVSARKVATLRVFRRKQEQKAVSVLHVSPEVLTQSPVCVAYFCCFIFLSYFLRFKVVVGWWWWCAQSQPLQSNIYLRFCLRFCFSCHFSALSTHIPHSWPPLAWNCLCSLRSSFLTLSLFISPPPPPPGLFTYQVSFCMIKSKQSGSDAFIQTSEEPKGVVPVCLEFFLSDLKLSRLTPDLLILCLFV